MDKNKTNMKIKVIHVCDKFGVKGSSVHGVSRLFSWWFPRFDSQRFDVQLLGLRRPDQAMEYLIEQGLHVNALSKGKYDFTTAGALMDVVKTEKPDILHLHGYGAANFGRMIVRNGNVKILLHEHVVDPAFPKYQVPFDWWLSKRTDWAIAVSESVKDFLVHKRHIPANRVEVVFNGAPIDSFLPAGSDVVQEIKERYGVPADFAVVGAIGRLDKQKGFKYLVDAAAILINKGIRAKFIIAGDGPLLEDLKERSRQNQIESDVIFPGFCSDVRPIQSTFDIQVFPSLWEGTPLTLFEAMAMSRAIVSTSVDGLGEVVRNGENGLVVPVRDPESLAGALEKLINERELRERLARQAYLDSRQFDIRKTVDRLQAIYERLAKE
jgi:glycosyltransferase involved in cell wall biosynthesis